MYSSDACATSCCQVTANDWELSTLIKISSILNDSEFVKKHNKFQCNCWHHQHPTASTKKRYRAVQGLSGYRFNMADSWIRRIMLEVLLLLRLFHEMIHQCRQTDTSGSTMFARLDAMHPTDPLWRRGITIIQIRIGNLTAGTVAANSNWSLLSRKWDFS